MRLTAYAPNHWYVSLRKILYLQLNLLEFMDIYDSSLKSSEVEGWIDGHIARPAGFFFAKGFSKLGVHPNVVSVLSILAGIGSSFFFAHGSFHYEGVRGLIFNVIAAVLLFLCGVLDNSDGQLARMTGKTSNFGRMLDGASAFFFYPFIYWGLFFRIIKYHTVEFSLLDIPPTHQSIILLAIAMCILLHFSGYICFASQMRKIDYYVQAHLFFQKKGGGELEESSDLQKQYDSLQWKTDFWWKTCMKLYLDYTKAQERSTPQFQIFKKVARERFGSLENVPETLRSRFHDGSRPLMKYVILLSFHFRSIMLVLFCLLDIPFGYICFEIAVFSYICRMMIRRHEKLCRQLTEDILTDSRYVN